MPYDREALIAAMREHAEAIAEMVAHARAEEREKTADGWAQRCVHAAEQARAYERERCAQVLLSLISNPELRDVEETLRYAAAAIRGGASPRAGLEPGILVPEADLEAAWPLLMGVIELARRGDLGIPVASEAVEAFLEMMGELNDALHPEPAAGGEAR